MNKAGALLLVLTLTTPYLIVILPAKATPRTVIVPDNFSTITDAITNALEGDKILVKKGTYEYPINQTLVIDKTLSIIGEDPRNTRINIHPPWISNIIFTQDFSGFAPPIKIEANDVSLSGLTFSTDEEGTLYSNGNGTQLVNNNFLNFAGLSLTGDNCTIVDNSVSGSIQLNGNYGNVSRNTFTNTMWVSGSYNFVSENRLNWLKIQSQAFVGRGSYNEFIGNYIVGPNIGGNVMMQIRGDHNLVFENTVTLVQNEETATGNQEFPYIFRVAMDISSSESIVARNTIFNCSGGIIVGFSTTRNTIIFGNNITGTVLNLGNGIQLVGFNAEVGMLAENNIIFGNYIANFHVGIASNGYNNTIFLNDFVNNTQQTDCLYFGEPNYRPDNFDSGKEGNYYSDYHGADTDKD